MLPCLASMIFPAYLQSPAVLSPFLELPYFPLFLAKSSQFPPNRRPRVLPFAHTCKSLSKSPVGSRNLIRHRRRYLHKVAESGPKCTGIDPVEKRPILQNLS